MSSKSTRRKFLRQVGIAAGLAAVPLGRRGRAQTKRQVIMRLDWLYQGPNAGFLIAQDKGFYEQAGLNVEIGPGKGSGSTAQLVASKATQFGFADGFVVGNSVSKGMSIKMVAGIFRRNPTAVVVLDESDIKTPKDLEGKTIAIPTGSVSRSPARIRDPLQQRCRRDRAGPVPRRPSHPCGLCGRSCGRGKTTDNSRIPG